MKAATFNCNSIRSRLTHLLDWMKTNDPDIVCLQETKVQDDSFPRQPILDAGYHVVFKGEKGYNGVCIISREPASKSDFGLQTGDSPDEARLAYAKIGAYHVVNTYVPQGRSIDHDMYRYKQDWLKRLRDYFDSRFTSAGKVLWVGDMNVARGPEDIHNADQQKNHVCFHVDARKSFENVIDWGFVDLLRKFHAEKGQYTFFDYRTPNAVKRGMGWRIDYIFASPPLASRCSDCYIDTRPRLQEKPSDHTILVAEFK